MNKNYDNTALILAIVGIGVSSINWLVALQILPMFVSYIPLIVSGVSVAGLVLAIISLKTSEHKWKPILAIIIYIITVILNLIFSIPLFFTLYAQIQELLQSLPYY